MSSRNRSKQKKWNGPEDAAAAVLRQLGVGARLEQQLDDLRVTAPRRDAQARLAEYVESPDVGARGEEPLHDVVVPGAYGDHERRAPAPARLVRLGGAVLLDEVREQMPRDLRHGFIHRPSGHGRQCEASAGDQGGDAAAPRAQRGRTAPRARCDQRGAQRRVADDHRKRALRVDLRRDERLALVAAVAAIPPRVRRRARDGRAEHGEAVRATIAERFERDERFVSMRAAARRRQRSASRSNERPRSRRCARRHAEDAVHPQRRRLETVAGENVRSHLNRERVARAHRVREEDGSGGVATARREVQRRRAALVGEGEQALRRDRRRAVVGVERGEVGGRRVALEKGAERRHLVRRRRQEAALALVDDRCDRGVEAQRRSTPLEEARRRSGRLVRVVETTGDVFEVVARLHEHPRNAAVPVCSRLVQRRLVVIRAHKRVSAHEEKDADDEHVPVLRRDVQRSLRVLRRRVRAQPRSEEHRDHVAVPVERRPMQRGVAVRVSREGVLRTIDATKE